MSRFVLRSEKGNILKLSSAVGILIMGIVIGLFSDIVSSYIPIILVYCFIISIFITSKNSLLFILLIWISLQNLILPWMMIKTDFVPIVWTVIIAINIIIPALSVIFWLLPLLVKRNKLPKWFGSIVIYSVVVTGSFLPYFIKGDILETLYYFRMLFIPFLYFMVGYIYTHYSNRRLQNMLTLISVITVVGSIASIIDYLWLSVDFWSNMGIGQYWVTVKGLPKEYLINSLPSNFYSYYGDHLIRRSISIYGDPLAAGYSMASGFVAWILLRFGFSEKKNNLSFTLLIAMVILIGLGLTFTRASYLIIVAFIVFLMIFSKEFRSLFPRIGYLMVFGVLLVMGGEIIRETLAGNNSSASIHLDSLISIPQLLSHPFGTGTFSMLPEGTYQSILWTIGISPLIAGFFWIKRIYPRECDIRNTIVMGLIWSIILTGVISAEMLTPACGYAWAIMGGILSISDEIVPKASAL